MTTMRAKGGFGETQISAVIRRADGRVEDLGVISYWSKSPLRRLLWRITRWLHW
jgi:hypothetical protein